MTSTIRLESTGETITFLPSDGASTEDRLLLDVRLPRGASGPPPHIHHRQAESFEVLGGRLGVQVGDERTELQVGERITVPAGASHTWWNAGDDTLHFAAEVTPALNMEWMLREIFASCNRRGAAEPSPWDGSYVLSQINGEYSLVDIPQPVQRYVFPIVAAIGRLLGLTKVHTRP